MKSKNTVVSDEQDVGELSYYMCWPAYHPNERLGEEAQLAGMNYLTVHQAIDLDLNFLRRNVRIQA